MREPKRDLPKKINQSGRLLCEAPSALPPADRARPHAARRRARPWASLTAIGYRGKYHFGCPPNLHSSL